MLEIPGVQYWPTLPDSYWQLSDLDPRRQIAFDNAVEEAIAHNNAAIDAASLDDFIPAMFERKREGGVDVVARTTFGEGACGNFSMAEDGQSRGITSILTLRPFDGGVSVESDHVVTNWPTVYASADVLLLAEMAEEWWWFWNNDSFDEATNIHRFDISTPGKTVYRGSGRIDGLVPGQFGLSEHQGDVRVAATTGQWNRWWLENPNPTENHVYVLRGAESLDVIGHVGGIASGERIWASRFDDDKAYLVTFQSIDPLFTVDLSSPAHPKVIGELEIPGVSTYIHPLDGDRLLTIGIGGTEDGLSWGETQLSLFDVSDFAHPARDAVLGLTPGEVSANDGWAWSWSEALYEHKAFQYWGPQSMLAVPTSTYRSFNDGNHWGYEYRSLLQLVKVEGDTLSLHGTVDHSALYNADPETWWYWRDIRRSIFMGDFIYVVSDLGVTVHDLETLDETASVLLAGSNDLCQSYWYCY